jgi:hypothetical protein
MKMYELLAALPALQKVGGQDLPLKTLYKVSRVLKKLDENLNFFNSRREALIVEYCTIRDGNPVPKDEYRKEYNTKFAELLNLDVELDQVEPVVIPMSENLVLSYNDLVALEAFVQIEGD